MKLFDRIKYWGGSMLEREPHAQFLAKKLILRMPWLLPHDKSYFGFRHCLDHPCKLFLDVGANDGVSAASFRRLDRSFKIVSIEPNRYHEPSLRWLSGRLNDMQYQLIGAGDTEETLTLYVPFYKNIPLHTAASLELDDVQTRLARFFAPSIARKLRYEPCTVEVVPLDTLGLKPGIIKIDAEGFDHRVLRGLQNTIADCRPYIMSEIHLETVDAISMFCAKSQYALLDYFTADDSFAPYNGGQARNVFCVPLERVERLLDRERGAKAA